MSRNKIENTIRAIYEYATYTPDFKGIEMLVFSYNTNEFIDTLTTIQEVRTAKRYKEALLINYKKRR